MGLQPNYALVAWNLFKVLWRRWLLLQCGLLLAKWTGLMALASLHNMLRKVEGLYVTACTEGLPLGPLAACVMASGAHAREPESSGAATRIAAQVRLLYGPLLACVTASKSAFTAMVQQHGDGDTASFVRAARENPEGPQGKIYRCAPGRPRSLRGSRLHLDLG